MKTPENYTAWTAWMEEKAVSYWTKATASQKYQDGERALYCKILQLVLLYAKVRNTYVESASAPTAHGAGRKLPKMFHDTRGFNNVSLYILRPTSTLNYLVLLRAERFEKRVSSNFFGIIRCEVWRH